MSRVSRLPLSLPLVSDASVPSIEDLIAGIDAHLNRPVPLPGEQRDIAERIDTMVRTYINRSFGPDDDALVPQLVDRIRKLGVQFDERAEVSRMLVGTADRLEQAFKQLEEPTLSLEADYDILGTEDT